MRRTTKTLMVLMLSVIILFTGRAGIYEVQADPPLQEFKNIWQYSIDNNNKDFYFQWDAVEDEEYYQVTIYNDSGDYQFDTHYRDFGISEVINDSLKSGRFDNRGWYRIRIIAKKYGDPTPIAEWNGTFLYYSDVCPVKARDVTITYLQKSYSYTGSEIKPVPAVSFKGRLLEPGKEYTVSYGKNIDPGIGRVMITGTGKGTDHIFGFLQDTFTISPRNITDKGPSRLKNTLKVQGKTITVKYAGLKKKMQTIKRKQAFKVRKAKGAVTFKKVRGNKKIKVSSKGKITVKKGLKKGTYKIRVKVRAVGNELYQAGLKTVTLKVKVE